jgi:hypothetical protein
MFFSQQKQKGCSNHETSLQRGTHQLEPQTPVRMPWRQMLGCPLQPMDERIHHGDFTKIQWEFRNIGIFLGCMKQ